MVRHTFWTQRRFTGIILMVSCLLYVGAGALLPKDAQGNYIVNLPQRDQLLVIFAHPQLWQWDISLYISGVIVMLLGLAMLSTRVLPHWVGWLAIVYGLAGLGLVGITGDADPLLHLVMPIVIGILLLLRRYQVPAGSRREEVSTVASTTAIN
jgi:hypothetical protein